MKNKIPAIIFIIIIMAIGGYYFFINKKDSQPSEPPLVLEPQTDVQGSVTVTATPLKLGAEEPVWDFEIVMDTHAVELNIDLAQVSILIDDRGTEYEPFVWEGAGLGGHHRSGILRFNNISPLPKSLELRIESVGDGISRSFRWQLEESATMTVKVFFNNDRMDPEFSCNKVFPVERVIPKTQAVARVALEELLKGPTEAEKSAGFLTSIPEGAKIQRLAIEEGVAKADFNEALEFQIGGSCRVSAIRAQITETLKQFPTVNEVVISIDSRTEDILQP